MAGSIQSAERWRVHAALACVAALAWSVAAPGPGRAGQASQPERARAVLEAHCAECREAHANGAALDLASLAGNPRLVVPKSPDASRIYQNLLAAQAIGAGSAPSPEDVAAVREWIENLPARDAACRGRKRLANADVAASIAAWSQRHASEKADTRFISLVHLWNACAPEQRLKDYTEAVKVLLAALARRREPLEIEALGEAGTVLVARLSKLALVPAEWVRLMETAPRIASADAVPADWLAARVLARPTDAAGNIDAAFDVTFDAAGQVMVESLARLWTQDVDLTRAAAERGVEPRALAGKLANVGGEFLQPARRLLHGALARPAWENLSLALDGEARPGSALSGAPQSETTIDVLLWTDKPSYRPRDLVTFNVTVERACHLTLIDIDQDGKAIVLFPNELDQDNLIAPGVTVRIPGNEAGYQFRFDRSGAEQIVAICRRKSRNPGGIAYDYERQRFAILGDWRTFLRTIPNREKEIRAREEAEAARRKRRGRRPAPNGPPAIDPDGPPVEGRTAITVTIDPGKP